MQIKNINFISLLMQKRDICEAFVFKTGYITDEIYALIGEGYIHRRGDRWFIPTQKLLEEIFLPKCGFITLEDHQRRYLAVNNSFYLRDLVNCFGNETIVNRLIIVGYLRLEGDKRYRKATVLEDILAEGGDIIKL